MSAGPGDLRERVRRVPGMERLLPALEGLEPAYLVGGAVRDLLRGAAPNDIDIAVEGDARSVARAVAKRLGSDAREYERFGTATVETPATSYNFATTRREAYDEPGALPQVAPAPLAEDLGRRDFSINAMAVGLTGDDLGHLYDPTGGLADMEARLVRVLHERSFLDDPTRLLRAVRYAVRLGFALDPETERLAREAAAADALSTVSGARIRDELMDLLGELDAPAAIKRMRDLEIHTALHPELDPDPELVASASLGAVAIGADRGIAALAALIEDAPEKLDLWLADLHLFAEERDAAARAARVAPRIAAALREREHSPSELRELLGREPLEALALAMALGAPPDPILRWASELRPVTLEISGADLLAAGVSEGPAVGRALDETLNRKLDGLVSGRDAELETALLLARDGAQ
jgi:tRNA nucleotidyltransferase (CCA-adding enzyme)